MYFPLLYVVYEYLRSITEADEADEHCEDGSVLGHCLPASIQLYALDGEMCGCLYQHFG